VSGPGILVDVDGTLVDSNYHHTIAWSRALRDHGRNAHLAAIHRLIGMGGTELLRSLFPGDADDDGDHDAIKASWRTHFDALLPEVCPFQGAAGALRALRKMGLAVVLATSSPADLLAELRLKIGGDDAIDVVVSADDVERAKPEPDIFRVALDKARLDAHRVLVLGDSVWDVEAARRAGLGCVGVETGGFSRLELEAAGVLHVYRDPLDLTANLGTGPIAALVARNRAARAE
jgi:HAD superfamily hydrolase (TIGR01509 family)